MPAERIVSLVPAATEICFELGLGDEVRAVSHACDHPPEVEEIPAASRVRIDAEGFSREIDEAVRGARDGGEPLYEVLQEVLHHAQPDLVVTQEACEVCGITPLDVEAAMARIEPVERPEMVTMHPHTLGDVGDAAGTIADAAGAPERGRKLAEAMAERIEAVAQLADGAEDEPTVAALDWLDPPMAAGHWVPDMVEAAGGQPALLDEAEPSSYVDWADVVDAAPDILLLIPCGFTAERTVSEADALRHRDGWESLPAVQEDQVYTLDAGAYTSRPGPRLVDGLEQIACILQGTAARERWPEQAARVRKVE